MTTTSIQVGSSAYVEVSTGDALVQNSSAYPIFTVFANSLPSVNTTDRHVLRPGEAITKSGGIPTGNIYCRSAIEDYVANVAISE